MMVYKLLNLLHGLDGEITWQRPYSCGFTAIEYNEDSDKTVKLIIDNQITNGGSRIYLPYKSSMCVEDIKSILGIMPLDAEVMIVKDLCSNAPYEPLLFVDASTNGNICLKSRGSMDLTEEFQTLFDHAANMFASEPYFYEDLLVTVFTLKVVREFLGDDSGERMV